LRAQITSCRDSGRGVPPNLRHPHLILRQS
jgi:hypothetical protein